MLKRPFDHFRRMYLSRPDANSTPRPAMLVAGHGLNLAHRRLREYLTWESINNYARSFLSNQTGSLGLDSFRSPEDLFGDLDTIIQSVGLIGEAELAERFGASRKAVEKALVRGIIFSLPLDPVIMKEVLTSEESSNFLSFVLSFERVFTLNYDPILYLISDDYGVFNNGGTLETLKGEVLSSSSDGFDKEGGAFDERSARVLYLHGAFHLNTVHTESLDGKRDKKAFKRTMAELRRMVASRDHLQPGQFEPVLVSARNGAEKLRIIHENAYTRSCYHLFKQDSCKMDVVVYGASLQNDEHLLLPLLWEHEKSLVAGCPELEMRRVIFLAHSESDVTAFYNTVSQICRLANLRIPTNWWYVYVSERDTGWKGPWHTPPAWYKYPRDAQIG